MTPMEAARAALKEVFGYDDFRPGQEDAVAAILRGRDVMAVMPTGAGKSICYQIPALVRHPRRFAAHFADARSGLRAAAKRRARGLSQQLPHAQTVYARAGSRKARRL